MSAAAVHELPLPVENTESRSSGPVSVHPKHIGLYAHFQRWVSFSPHKIAAIYGAQELSFFELDRRANYLATQLIKLGITQEEPVGILLDPSLDQIVCQLAVIRAGGSCLPLDPGAPDERLKFMLEDLNVQIVITTTMWKDRVCMSQCLLMEHEDQWQTEVPQFEDGNEYILDAEHRTHILFTSGTTGRPKAVQILARGIIRLTVNPSYVTLGTTDRIAGIANPTFDASLFEIWGALLNGATVILLPKQTAIDPYALRHSLRVQRVTTMFITTTLFNQTVHACPDAFSGLHQVLVGGEMLNPKTLGTVLKSATPPKLINGYGPTECTTFAVCHLISSQDVEGEAIPLGRPIDNTQVFVLNSELGPVETGEIGEIYLAGDGLARGYWNRPELTAERFIQINGPMGDSIRLYKTGDLGSWRIDGILLFHGRNDNQVKIRGHRIELEEIETTLVASGLLRGAAVAVQQTELGEKYLLAFVVPDQQTPEGESFSIDELTRYLQVRLPSYMHPRLAVVPSLPVNANGKVDRPALLLGYRREMEPKQTGPQSGNTSTIASDTLGILCHIWRRTLDIDEIDINSDFFSLGGTSLQAASLVVQVGKRFGQPLSVQALYEYPAPTKLAYYLDNRAQLNNSKVTADEIAGWLADTSLSEDIQPVSGPVSAWTEPGCGRVFLTGVTGFLGAFVLRDLLQMHQVKQVACLVRAKSDFEGLGRIRENLLQYGIWSDEFARQIVPVIGDLAQPKFGLELERFEVLSRWSDVIFHLGAHVNYIQPYSAHRAANVIGTMNVLRFATTAKPKPLHYASTIAAFGPAGLLEPTAIVYEDDDLANFMTGLKFDSGYSQSQWVTEQLVWNAQRRGIPLAVYRPGFIMGHSQTGAGNPNDFVARLVKGCIAIGSYPKLPRQRKEFVPVDYVSSALLHIARDNNNLSRAYHLVPPQSAKSIDLMSFFEVLRDCGYPVISLPYPEWVRRLADAADLQQNPLMPLLPMLAEPIYGQKTRWEVYEGMPAYDASNTQRALADADSTLFRPLDHELLNLYIKHWEEV